MKPSLIVIHLFPTMRISLLAFLLLLPTRRVVATDNYAYRKDEYAEISGGKSPDGRWSIAAHGDDSAGYDGFQLHLMREPAHKRVFSLPADEHLDTAPLSNVAIWAPDSHHVIILYRTDRHVLDLRLFRVASDTMQSIKVPSLASTVSQGRLSLDGPEELIGRYYQLSWQDTKRFILEEFDAFSGAKPFSQAELEAYFKTDDGEERNLTSFSAQALYELTDRSKVSISKIKPLPDQERTIVYSPHLRFDHERGLYNTETSVSSLEAQKDQKKAGPCKIVASDNIIWLVPSEGGQSYQQDEFSYFGPSVFASEYGGVLTVNTRSYGVLKIGDSVDLTTKDVVLVNGQVRQPGSSK